MMGSISSIAAAPKSPDEGSNGRFHVEPASKGEPLNSGFQSEPLRKDSVTSLASLDYRKEQKKHPELRETLNNFDLMVQLLQKKSTDDLSDVEDILQENFTEPLAVFSAEDQKRALGNALAEKGFVEVTVEYYALILKFMDRKCFTDDILLRGEPFARVLYLLRGCLWNYSDSSPRFCQRIAETEMFAYLVKDLKEMEPHVMEMKDSDWAYMSVASILHNCAKARVSRHYFRDNDVVSHLLPFLKTTQNLIKLTTLLTLAYIIEEDQNHLLTADNTLFDFFMQRLKLCMKCKDLRFDGFSFEEQLAGLARLAKNDANKQIIMEKGALNIIHTVFETVNKEEVLESATELLWELSFDDRNKRIIKKNEAVMKKLEELSKSRNKKISKAAGGVLLTLSFTKLDETKEKIEDMKNIMQTNIEKCLQRGEALDELQDKSMELSAMSEKFYLEAKKVKKKKKKEQKSLPDTPTISPVNKGHIMISYNWSDQPELKKVRDYLKAAGYSVWMDIDNMEGSTLQAMAEAVEKSAVILMCMSERYKDSQNCRTEAEYAWQLKKDIIPLQMQRKYKPDGWLGILLGTRLFFEFSGKYSFEMKIEQLVKELGDRGRITKPNKNGVILKPADEVDIVKVKVPVVTVSKNTPNVWTEKDVENFLRKNDLENVKDLKELTGPEFLFLQKLSKKAPEYFYSYCERQLGVTKLKDLMNLTNAIETL